MVGDGLGAAVGVAVGAGAEVGDGGAVDPPPSQAATIRTATAAMPSAGNNLRTSLSMNDPG